MKNSGSLAENRRAPILFSMAISRLASWLHSLKNSHRDMSARRKGKTAPDNWVLGKYRTMSRLLRGAGVVGMTVNE